MAGSPPNDSLACTPTRIVMCGLLCCVVHFEYLHYFCSLCNSVFFFCFRELLVDRETMRRRTRVLKLLVRPERNPILLHQVFGSNFPHQLSLIYPKVNHLSTLSSMKKWVHILHFLPLHCLLLLLLLMGTHHLTINTIRILLILVIILILTGYRTHMPLQDHMAVVL